jgi:hypothetical protein
VTDAAEDAEGGVTAMNGHSSTVSGGRAGARRRLRRRPGRRAAAPRRLAGALAPAR